MRPAILSAAGGRRCRGHSLLEVQVAFAVLAVGLGGMCQLAVVQLRQVRMLELRFQGQVVHTSHSSGTSQVMLTGQTYYLVPWQNPWTQKLAGSAQIVAGASAIPCDPGPLPLPTSNGGGATLSTNWVNVLSLQATPTGQSVTACVSVGTTSP